MKQHFWQGEWIDEAEAATRLESFALVGHSPLAKPLDPELVIAACDRIGKALATGGPAARRLAGALETSETSEAEAALALRDLASFLAADGLRHTLHTELGDQPRLRARRRGEPSGSQTVVEGWEPVGLLAHVVPSNAAVAGPVSLVEGLLSGNANIVKTSGRQGPLTQCFAAELAAVEPRIAPYAIVLGFGSARRSWLERMCRPADGVVVWGGEAAVAGVAALVPAGARLIVWGPKISFGYLTLAASADRDVLAAIAHDVCAGDQRACTSPQLVYVDTTSKSELWGVASRLAVVLSEVDAGYPEPRPDQQEQAEITNTVLVARHEEHLGLTRVLSHPAGRWHVLAETDPALRASPLFRTIWVKPLPREAIVTTLRPMRRYLQTVGVSPQDGLAPTGGPSDLVATLIAAGADRVTALGHMHEAYPGEPHDGEYPLRRYSRRVVVRLPDAPADLGQSPRKT